MRNVSAAFLRALANDKRDYQNRLVITLADNTEIEIDNSRIWDNGVNIQDSVSANGVFQIGAAIINQGTFTINNIYDDYSEYDFDGAVVVAYTGLNDLDDGTDEEIKLGTYTVDETKYNGSLIVLTCLDNMAKFDQVYDTNLVYPATLEQIVLDACTKCGVTLDNSSLDFPHKSYNVTTKPSSDNTTYRQVISWAAQIAGCFARCNVDGKLEFRWYPTDELDDAISGLDGGVFDNVSSDHYTTGDTADGGSFNPWNTGDVYDGGTFSNLLNIHLITSSYTSNLSTDDVVITGVTVIKTIKTEGSTDIYEEYSSGTSGYVIVVEKNDFIDGQHGQDIADWLGTQLIGVRFRQADLIHPSDPSIEAGDVAIYIDRKENIYGLLVSSSSFVSGNSQTTRSSAETPARNSAKQFTETTRNYVELRKRQIADRTAWEEAESELSQRIDNAGGLYCTEVVQPDTSVLTYYHDKPQLSDSSILMLFSSTGFTLSSDGGTTWYGMTVDGTFIAGILNSIGINADWINSGAISISDANNVETFYADTVTGAVRIKATSFSLTGWNSGDTIDSRAQGYATTAETNAKNYSYGQLTGWITNTYTPDKTGLQNQIDGKIETFRQSADPSTAWTDSTTKAKHVGDMWYCTASSGTYAGKTWQYVYENSTYSWQEMTADPPQEVFNTINGKAQIFTSQPVPPYSVGDLWLNSSTSDIMTCTTARASGSYTSSDWEKRNKYTDDTTANTAIARLETQYGTCSTAASTAAKEVTCANFEYYTGAKISVTFTYENSASSPTLNVNSKGAKSIRARGSTITSKDYWTADSVVDFVYDGTYWIMCNVESQEEIFNRLTNGQANQGIYLDNGDLYINANLIKTGNLTVGGTAVNVIGQILVKDSYDNTIASMSKSGIDVMGMLLSYRSTDGFSTRINEGRIFFFSGNYTYDQLKGLTWDYSSGSIASAKSYSETTLTDYDLNGLAISSPKDFIVFGKKTAYETVVGYLYINTSGGKVLGYNEKLVLHNSSLRLTNGNINISLGSINLTNGNIDISLGSINLTNGNVKIKTGDVTLNSPNAGASRIVRHYHYNDASTYSYMSYSTTNHRFFMQTYPSGTVGLSLGGDLIVSGTKNRVVETEHYGTVGMNAFETSSSHFADIGSGTVGKDGTVTIFFDPVFAETIDTRSEYQVFLTRTSEAVTTWVDKQNGFFIVHGESGATFDWMIVGYQKDYVTNRMEQIDTSDEAVNDDPIAEDDNSALEAVEEMVSQFNAQVEEIDYGDN